MQNPHQSLYLLPLSIAKSRWRDQVHHTKWQTNLQSYCVDWNLVSIRAITEHLRRLGNCNWSTIANLVTKGEKGFVESVVSMNLEGFVCKIYCKLFLLADHLVVVHYGEIFPPSTHVFLFINTSMCCGVWFSAIEFNFMLFHAC